jgi:hypothetical protein
MVDKEAPHTRKWRGIGFGCSIDNRQHGVAIIIAARAIDAHDDPVLVLVFARHRAPPDKTFSIEVSSWPHPEATVAIRHGIYRNKSRRASRDAR